jgi:hypothetical protein
MPTLWTIEKLQAKSPQEIQSLYRNAKNPKNADNENARALVDLILEHDLLRDEQGGLPFDHPIMLEIEEICAAPEAIQEALEAAEQGQPPLAGMEHRIVTALGDQYGGNYTTHHAGRCIGAAMLDRGWTQAGMKPMPKGCVAKTATVYVRKGEK